MNRGAKVTAPAFRFRNAHRHLPAMGLLAAALALSGVAHSTSEPTAALRPEARVLRGSGSSFAQLAAEIASLEVSEPSLVALGPIQGIDSDDDQSSHTEALWKALNEQVAGIVPLRKSKTNKPLTKQEARRRARELEVPLVYLNPRFEQGGLTLHAEVISWHRKFWRLSANPLGTKIAERKLWVAADSALRRLLLQADQLWHHEKAYPSPMTKPLGVACGDLDQDGKLDVALMDRHEILVGSITEKGFVLSKRKTWGELSPIAPTPLRAPLGNLRIADGRLDAGLSDRAHLVRLNDDLQLIANAPRSYPLDEGRCLDFSAIGLLPRPHPCEFEQKLKNHPPQVPERTSGEAAYDVFSTTMPNGSSLEARVTVSHGRRDGQIELTSTTFGARIEQLPHVGSALALADIDGDGAPDFLSSSDSKPGQRDTLVLRTYQKGRVVERARKEGDDVHAIAICPFTGKNPLTVVAAMGSELRIIR